MNTKRILTGGLLAGLTVFLGDYLINHVALGSIWHQIYLSGYLQKVRPYTVPVIGLQDFGVGFILMWLYALARPRLGPGPKTAFITGSLAWFLFFVPRVIEQWLWYVLPTPIPMVFLIGGFIECWAATYLAGWQYIEKAP